jgi:hypothetical protein
MLGNKMGFGPMMMLRPDGFKPKQDEKKENIVAADSEDKTYVNIVSEKTKVVTKKKPQLKKFNSTTSETRGSVDISKDIVSNITKENEISLKKKLTENILEIKEEVKEQIFEKTDIKEEIQKDKIKVTRKESDFKEEINNVPSQENKQNIFEQDLNKNTSSAKKLIFDDIPDSTVTTTKQEPKKPKESTTLKSKLFDFDDDDMDEIKKKRSETKLPNNDSGKQSKIKFLFDD